MIFSLFCDKQKMFLVILSSGLLQESCSFFTCKCRSVLREVLIQVFSSVSRHISSTPCCVFCEPTVSSILWSFPDSICVHSVLALCLGNLFSALSWGKHGAYLTCLSRSLLITDLSQCLEYPCFMYLLGFFFWAVLGGGMSLVPMTPSWLEHKSEFPYAFNMMT